MLFFSAIYPGTFSSLYPGTLSDVSSKFCLTLQTSALNGFLYIMHYISSSEPQFPDLPLNKNYYTT